MISKGRETFHPGKLTYVYSNLFRDSEPATRYPNPSLFSMRLDELQAIPKKRRSQESAKPKMRILEK